MFCKIDAKLAKPHARRPSGKSVDDVPVKASVQPIGSPADIQDIGYQKASR